MNKAIVQTFSMLAEIPFDKLGSLLYHSGRNENAEMQRCDPFRLIEALMRSGKTVEMQLDAALAPAALSAAKWGVLRQLAEAGEDLPLGQLATKLACVKSNVTQLMDRLEAEHLVRRV